jgi:hypothetical protein
VTPSPAADQPTEEELVAILAAVEAVWPRPAVAPPPAEEPLSLRWRFSGRWWTRSVISRRDRPWVGPQR